MSNSNEKFNVEHSALETALAEAPTGKTAGGAKNVVQQAVADAKVMDPLKELGLNSAQQTIGEEYTGESTVSATDKLQRDASKTTNAAVSEGKNDVDHIKAVSVGYVEQVKALAQTAIETAQTYLPTYIANKLPNFPEVTATTDADLRPPSDDMPATSAPLESGPHTVNSPYSSKINVGANEGAPRIHS